MKSIFDLKIRKKIDHSKTISQGFLTPGSSFSSTPNENAAKQDILDAIATSNPTTRKNKLIAAAVLGAIIPENASWTFDAVGNLATKTMQNLTGGSDVTKTMTYNNMDAVTNIDDGTTSTNYTYDTEGNLIGDGTKTYIWNSQSQLTSFNKGSVTTDFTYDPLGRRKTWSQGLTTKSYFYDSLDILSDGASSFLNGAGIDEPLQITNGSNEYSYLGNNLGSTSRLVNTSNGNPVSSYYYQSYGKLENNQTNPTPANPFTYTGREDDGNGLYYYRARYYDPSLEMFISQDPLGDVMRYVGGNPISLVDPLGLGPMGSFVGGTVGYGIGGLTGAGLGATGGTVVAPGPGTAAGGLAGGLTGSQLGGIVGVGVGSVLGSFIEDHSKNGIDWASRLTPCKSNKAKNDQKCEIQATQDIARCSVLNSPSVRARCYASANERRGYCQSRGVLGYPHLVIW